MSYYIKILIYLEFWIFLWTQWRQKQMINYVKKMIK